MTRLRSSRALARRELDLLRGLPAVLDVGLLASRSSAAARRAGAGRQLDPIDLRSLTDLAALFRSAADAVEFFETEGRSGSYPSGAMADPVDIAVDALLQDVPEDTGPAKASGFMIALASKIEALKEGGDQSLAVELGVVFDHLASVLEASVSHVGETTSRF